MGLSRRRIAVGATGVALAASAATVFALSTTSATASGGAGAVPLPGDWEGAGVHGLPLSFSLARRHGLLVATSIALGAPLTCPANERDAEAIPLADVSYAGPGATTGSSPALLSGQAARGDIAHLSGGFATPETGSFSVQVNRNIGCGWPSGTLAWQVHRTRRRRIADRTWTAPLSGPGIVAGRVKLEVAARGRVVRSVRISFTCQTRSAQTTSGFAAAPAYEFIRPDGRFYSPLNGNAVGRHPTTWAGRFTVDGVLGGTLSIHDPCTRRPVHATFRGRVASSRGRPGHGSRARD